MKKIHPIRRSPNLVPIESACNFIFGPINSLYSNVFWYVDAFDEIVQPAGTRFQPLSVIRLTSLHLWLVSCLNTPGLVTPLLKKPGLDVDDYKSYRPVTNLSTFSNILERLAIVRLKPKWPLDPKPGHCLKPLHNMPILAPRAYPDSHLIIWANIHIVISYFN